MNIEDVMERFILMADISAARAEKFRPLCEDAMEEIGRRAVQSDAQAQKALATAAAALTFYRWALAGAASGPAVFSAGDVKIAKSAETAALAREAWREAEASAAPYLADDGFLFRRARP